MPITDPGITAKLLTLAENGDVHAQETLGAILASDFTSAPEPAGGLYWYLKAVAQGHVTAMWNAGSMLVDGEGGILARELGLELIHIAAENYESSSCLFLEACYSRGLYGLEVDEERARQYAKDAWEHYKAKIMTDPFDLSRYPDVKYEKPDIAV